MAIHEEHFVIDKDGKRIGVVLDIADYQKGQPTRLPVGRARQGGAHVRCPLRRSLTHSAVRSLACSAGAFACTVLAGRK